VVNDAPQALGGSHLADPLLHALQLHARLGCRLRGLWLALRIRAIGGQVGKRLVVDRRVQVITARGASWHIGDGVEIGTGVLLSVSSGARLSLGDNVRIGSYVVIGAEESIVLHDRAGVAEFSSVRDHDHDVSAPSMRWGGVVSAPITLGADCWVARGVAVLRGAVIGADAVIGANAVVRGEIPANALAVGIPARVVRYREVADERVGRGSGTPQSRTGPAA
jgi:acetyltransferase-like isoleucine patch superfamily enzyme